MKMEKTLTVGKARSLLPNSSPEILKPMRGCDGTFRIVWIEQIDSHALYFQYDDEDSGRLLATHNNGHSCHCLAERMIAGNGRRVYEQADYIRNCGGTAVSVGHCLDIMTPHHGQAE